MWQERQEAALVELTFLREIQVLSSKPVLGKQGSWTGPSDWRHRVPLKWETVEVSGERLDLEGIRQKEPENSQKLAVMWSLTAGPDWRRWGQKTTINFAEMHNCQGSTNSAAIGLSVSVSKVMGTIGNLYFKKLGHEYILLWDSMNVLGRRGDGSCHGAVLAFLATSQRKN